jgi:hypothetical protein
MPIRTNERMGGVLYLVLLPKVLDGARLARRSLTGTFRLGMIRLSRAY